jgi:UDP-3-O-[3-hydroxymyristoyl] glucosamine N-acyltransferase LpxD
MTTFADIAEHLGARCDLTTEVVGVSTSAEPKPGTLAFMTSWGPDAEQRAGANPETLFLVPEDAPSSAPANAVRVSRPRLSYALVLRDLLVDVVPAVIQPTAAVADTAIIAEHVNIGHFTVVEDGVQIGAGSVIGSHVFLASGVVIGENCRIGSHTSIGGPGFGFEVDDEGRPVRIGHRGGVVIGDDVEIGNQVSIAQGTIEPTRIDDHVKIDDCVFLAHNVHVGEAAFVIAGAEVSGSVTIGKRAWISPEVTIIQKVTIGDDALVGIGAVVVKDVDENTIVAGVPAKPRGLRHER